MKRILIAVIVLAILIAGIALTCFLRNRAQPVAICGTESLYFSHTLHNERNGTVICTLQREADGCWAASYKPLDVPPEETAHFYVSEDDVTQLEAFLSSYDVGNWNGFDRSDRFSRDGRRFSLSISTVDGSILLAEGCMKWPPQFNAVAAGMEACFLDWSERSYAAAQ